MSDRRWLKIRDFLTIKPIEISEFKDYLKNKDAQGSKSLLLRVAATHAGIITGNRKFYRPDFMRDSAHTWIPANKPALPVLKGHNEEGDVLGRIREQKYVDESWKWTKEYPQLQNSYFLNQDGAKKSNIYKSIDYITGVVAKNPNYSGLGYIELGIELTNPDAIEKVLREEYLCVSAGAITDEAICSICHTDWASNDKCDHSPGEIIDGKKMFLISGRFRYEELSFVNFGADPFAAIKAKELKDSLEKMFFLGLSLGDQDLAIKNGLKITDSLYSSDIKISYEEVPMNIDFSALEEDIKDANLTSEKAFTLKDDLQKLKPGSDEDKSKLRGLKSTLTAKIRRNNWVQDSQEEKVVTDEMQTSVVINDADLNNILEEADSALTCEDGVCSWKGFTLSDEDNEFFSSEEKVYDELVKELEVTASGEKLTDKVLSTEARNKLGKGTFCGPGRSFPVPDKAHYIAALRLLNRAKVSPETKSKIHACILRKGKANGWVSESKDSLETNTEHKISDDLSALAMQTKLNENEKGDPATNPTCIHSILDCYDKLNTHHGDAETDLKYKIHDLHNALGEKWGKERWVDYAAQTLAKHSKVKDSVLISKEDLVLKEEAILSLTEEVTRLKDMLVVKDRSVAAFFKDSKRSLASAIVMHKIVSGHDGYVGLSAELVQDKINQLVTRRIESLKDSISDVFVELKWNKKEQQAVVVKNIDSATTTTIENNTRIDDAAVLNPGAEPLAVDLRDSITLQQALSHYQDDPVKMAKIRKIFLAELEGN
jgi:hypothetical protein